MRVSHFVFLFHSQRPPYTSMRSSSYGRLFHYEQPHLPISGPVHSLVQPFGKPFSHPLATFRPGFNPTHQLTSLSSLQTSLDILRAHKPPFMPRTGFVWPIMEPEATAPGSDQQTGKRKDTDETSTASTSSSRKQQNHFLLFNAMRTTAAHSSATFMDNTRPAIDQPPPAETAPPETVVERARSLSVAATPAPPLRRSSTPRVTGTSQPPELSKGQPSAPGVPPKRKKKRGCMHGGFANSVCLTRTCITGTNTAGNTPAPN